MRLRPPARPRILAAWRGGARTALRLTILSAAWLPFAVTPDLLANGPFACVVSAQTIEQSEGEANESASARAYFPNWPAADTPIPVRSVTIVRENIFSPEDLEQAGFYGRLANSLHTTTREAIIRRALFFEPGDSLTVTELARALRRLRGQPFLSAEVDMRVRGDSQAIDVLVRTRDSWSTRPELSFHRTGGLLEWSLCIREMNLLGLGKEVMARAGEDERDRFWGLGYRDPQLLGSRARLGWEANFGSERTILAAYLDRPFEKPASAWGASIEGKRLDGRWVDHRGGLEGPEWDADSRELAAKWLRRIGGAEEEAWRLGPFVHLVRQRFVWRDDGRDPEVESERLLPEALRPLQRRDIRAAGIAVDYLRERFRQHDCMDALGLTEDFDLGTAIELQAGFSPRAWGARREGAFLTLDGQQGLALGPDRLLVAYASGSGQVIDGRLSDAQLALQGRYLHRLAARHTLAAGLRGWFSEDLAPQDAITLGAEHGLRGFEAYRYWGDHAVVANLEDRILFVRDWMGLLSIGLAGFVDAGTAWREGQARDAHGRLSAGVGLRLHSRRASGTLVTRFDIAHPIAGGEDEGGWILSIGTGQAF